MASQAPALMYGGSAGGGKTWVLVADGVARALQSPGFSGIVFRRTYPELTQRGGPWSILSEMGRVTGGTVNESKHSVTWPNGSTFIARHLQHEHTVARYQGGEFTYVAFDELEHFSSGQVSYLVSRMRSSGGIKSLLRMTSNPCLRWQPIVRDWLDDDARLPRDRHDLPLGWLTFRDAEPHAVVGGDKPGPGWLRYRVIPAWLSDNTHLASDTDYADRLESLPMVDRARLAGGRWDVTAVALAFGGAQWDVVPDTDVPRGLRWWRSWDLAASAPSPAYPDPDYTRGVLMAVERTGPHEDTWIRHGVGGQLSASDRDDLIVATAQADGPNVGIVLEQEPGSGGKSQVEYLTRRLAGFRVEVSRPDRDKLTRLRPIIAAAERGRVHIVSGPWAASMLDEARVYPEGKRDWWDAVSQGHTIACPVAATPAVPYTRASDAPKVKGRSPNPGGVRW
jgi:predicted phage terminase large subunit-like protein